MTEKIKVNDIAALLRQEMENSKAKKNDEEEVKEECRYCHKLYKVGASLKQHESRCKSNTENQDNASPIDMDSIVKIVLEKVSANQEALSAEMKVLKAENESLKDRVSSIGSRKTRSSTEIFTELMNFCKGSSNPLFMKLYDNAVLASKKHWRVILIYTIDAMIASGML